MQDGNPHSENEPWPADGLSLSEARRRLAESEKWHRWQEAFEELSSFGPAPSWLDGGLRYDEVSWEEETRDRKRRLVKDLEAQVTAPLVKALHEGRLLAFGRMGNLRSEPQPITKDIWPSLSILRFDISAVGESRPNGDFFLAVRVFQNLSGHCRKKAPSDTAKPEMPSTTGKTSRRQKPSEEALLIEEFLRRFDPNDPILRSPKKVVGLLLERHPAFAKSSTETLRTRLRRAIKDILQEH